MEDTNKITSKDVIRSSGVYGINFKKDNDIAEMKKKKRTYKTTRYMVVLFKMSSIKLIICFYLIV